MKKKDIVSNLVKQANSKVYLEGFLSGDKSSRSIGLEEHIDIQTQHIFNDAFSLHLEGGMYLRQGTYQQVYLREGDASNYGIDIQSFYVNWNPRANWDLSLPEDMILNVQVGNLNQSFLEAPLLMGDWSFLGLRQNVFWLPHWASLYIDDAYLVFQQTIPPIQSELSRFQQVQDLPMFFTGSIFWETLYRNMFHIKGHFTHFYFRNLLGEVADKGLVLGNNTAPHTIGAESKIPISFFWYPYIFRKLF